VKLRQWIPRLNRDEFDETMSATDTEEPAIGGKDFRAPFQRFLAVIVLLPACLPLLMVFALTWITLGRPVLFRQVRAGLHGVPFTIVKFRTMTTAVDANGQLLPDAQRTTFATRLLRRIRLDELPQLFSIARGDMAIIGPRPLLPETIRAMGKWGLVRCSVRPGLAGWSQVNGNTLLNDEQKLALDIWYIDHRSLKLDRKRIFMALPQAVRRQTMADEVAQLQFFGRTLVIAPHPDDEVLGAGGTIARLSNAGHAVDVAIVTKGQPPTYPAGTVAALKDEAKQAHGHLGVHRTHWLDLPAAQLTETPTHEINAAILKMIRDVNPQTLLVPFIGDMHVDHQRIFSSCLVAARPHQALYPKTILAYETLSETNWNAPYVTPAFTPNVYVDIAGTLDRKLEAFRLYTSQVKDPPHERSIESLRTLASYRGATVHRSAAEAFVLIRQTL
jgi:N-acetylglucosamine malate deacetylase 1